MYRRPRSLLLLLPIPDVGPGRRPCFGQGGSVSPAATDDRRHPGKSLARARNRRSPGGTFERPYYKEKENGRLENPVLIIMTNRAPSRRATPHFREGRPPTFAKCAPHLREGRPPTFARPPGFALYIRRGGKGVLGNWKDDGGARADDVPLPDPSDGCVTPRTDGILMPMRKDSRADEKKFPWARERIACRREIVR